MTHILYGKMMRKKYSNIPTPQILKRVLELLLYLSNNKDHVIHSLLRNCNIGISMDMADICLIFSRIAENNSKEHAYITQKYKPTSTA